jgi:adenylosuccinate synthase
MTNLIIVGAQWGDEGKGKIVDMLAPDFDVVARYNGGHNAGHTVKVGDEVYKLHHIPSGIISGKMCVIGNGVLIDPKIFFQELEGLDRRGIKTDNLYVSSRAHAILPYHPVIDGVTGGKIGTTKRGIGPAYSDKMCRIGIRLEDLLLAEDQLYERIACSLDDKNFLIEKKYGFAPLYPREIAREYAEYGKRFRKHVKDTARLLTECMKKGSNIIFEGAQGTLLDIDHGTYPFVTSSNSTAGGACTGCGIGPRKIDKVIGVAKAYVTRVGNGPFPTERFDEWAEEVVKDGDEFGTTTGRKRRVGEPDFAILEYAKDRNSVDHWAIMKLDVLGGKEFRIAIEHDAINEYGAKPKYSERVFGWERIGEEQRRKIIGDGFDAMPEGMKEYLIETARFTGVPVEIASIGAGREETVTRNVLERTSACL